uniref:Uncharacterized protein n=1 Tax=Panagrolaimus sp. ES5 TaxID=591445 RepID=A0AC34G043_9BILA
MNLTKHLSSNIGHDSEEKDELKTAKNSDINKSTLSLHIAAYENSSEATTDSDYGKKEIFKNKVEKRSLMKKWNTAKEIFVNPTSIIQDISEFSRQQENEGTEKPEIAKFKASQKLLNPNQKYANHQPSKEETDCSKVG